MKCELYKPLWGHEGDLATALGQAREAGFSGIEGALPSGEAPAREFIARLRDSGLDYIGEISTTGYATPDPGAGVPEHLEAFERILDRTLPAQPRFFSTMAGSDLWSFGQSVEFLSKAFALACDRGVRVGFETHRSRSLYHPVRTRELLGELPPIELTLDFSHWCVVTERLVLDELPEVLELCAARALHLQPRIGYDQGPQVPDPRAPEYSDAVAAHLRWWRSVWEGQRNRGFEVVTMTPEFGPDGYLHLAPFTCEPVADLWELNRYVGALVREAFTTWQAG